MSDSIMDTSSDAQWQHGSVQETSSKSEDQARVTKCFGLFEGMQDKEHRNKLMQSWLITSSFLTLGLATGQIGATLLDLQIITQTDLESASAFLTGFTGGYMAGSLFSGVIFNKVDSRLLFFLGLSGLGVVAIISPHCSMYPLMIFIQTLIGFFAGAIDTSGNTWQMKLWGSEGKVLMQILHFAFALGGVLAPLYTEPFLAKRLMENETDTANLTSGNSSGLYLASEPQTTDVQYAYLVSGVLMISSSIPFLVLFMKQPSPKPQTGPEQIVNIKITYRELPFCLHIFIITAICTILMVYCCVELTFATFLMPFLINEYDSMTKAEAVYLTTVFWFSFAISRFLMIFLSKWLLSVQVLSLCVLLMITACIGLIISALFEVIPAIAVFTALAGLGMSGVFPAGFSWAETELLQVTPRVSASISISASTGKIFIPPILGFLMEEVSNMWFCYILLIQTGLLCLIFLFLLLLNRHFINRVYGSNTLLEQNVVVNGHLQYSIVPLKEENESLMKPPLTTTA